MSLQNLHLHVGPFGGFFWGGGIDFLHLHSLVFEFVLYLEKLPRYSHLLASTLSLRTAGPATVLSHQCDILSLLKGDQTARNNHLPAPSGPKSLHALLNYYGINSPKYYTYTYTLELFLNYLKSNAITLTIPHYNPKIPHCTYTLELFQN